MRRTKRQNTPGFGTPEDGFGNKGQGDQAKSFGEMLLSGKPTEHRASPHAKTQPHIRPRAKPIFGRGPVVAQDQPAPENAGAKDRSVVMIFSVGLALAIGALLLAGGAFFLFGSDMT